MKRYRLYGLDLASELPLAYPVPELPPGAAAGAPDLTLALAEPGRALPGEDDPGAEAVYRSPERTPDGEPVLTVTRARDATLLRYAGEATFSLAEPDGRRVVARPESPGADGRALVELRFLGPVLAFHLERSGTLALHAAAVTIAGGAVAVAATGGGGKSSLAAALLAAGHPLLADDVLAVAASPEGGFTVHPSYPQVRFDPEGAERWLGAARAAGLPRAHPGFPKLRVPVAADGLGRFDPAPRPLARIYLLDRRTAAGPIAIEPVSAREAVLALLAGSFLPRLVEAMGWGRRRLGALGALASAVPVRRLVLPAGLGRLPEAAERVAEDAASPA